ncbi:hypothetical protein BC831DRAFT_460148 [Entophlyctis helioformis]|nr:hypothetical protein BC831DRAFT_460148 [Entophlyctis helioformis]
MLAHGRGCRLASGTAKAATPRHATPPSTKGTSRQRAAGSGEWAGGAVSVLGIHSKQQAASSK